MSELSLLLDRLSRALDAVGIDLRRRSGINEGVLRLSSSASEKKRGVRALPKWRLVRALAYIDANVSKAITLPDLSAAAGMSRMYFASQFRAATGNRPHDFILRRRIEHAQSIFGVRQVQQPVCDINPFNGGIYHSGIGGLGPNLVGHFDSPGIK
jgi:AraC family transcriptional regulator